MYSIEVMSRRGSVSDDTAHMHSIQDNTSVKDKAGKVVRAASAMAMDARQSQLTYLQA